MMAMGLQRKIYTKLMMDYLLINLRRIVKSTIQSPLITLINTLQNMMRKNSLKIRYKKLKKWQQKLRRVNSKADRLGEISFRKLLEMKMMWMKKYFIQM
jgi:hypothetical protein